MKFTRNQKPIFKQNGQSGLDTVSSWKKRDIYCVENTQSVTTGDKELLKIERRLVVHFKTWICVLAISLGV